MFLVTNGDAARQVFVAEVVNAGGAAAAADAVRRIGANDFLAAAFSAAHSVRLTARTAWTSSDQERMVAELSDEVALALRAEHDASAAKRAALLVVLSGQFPGSEEEVGRLRKALSTMVGTGQVYRSVSVADQVADYLLLGGQPFWSEDEFRDMRAAVIADFEDCMSRGDHVLAADRLAIFDVLESSYDAPTSTTNDMPP